MANLIDFSNIGSGIDAQMNNAALAGQKLGYNDATMQGQIAATNAGNQANVSNSQLQVNNNQRQQQFQMESSALAANPNATSADYQALANKYPEFASQVNGNQQQTQTNWANIRQRMSSDAVATVAGMQARLQAGDTQGALDLLEQRAVRQENSGDAAGAASTRAYESLINSNPTGAKNLADRLLGAQQITGQYLNYSGSNTAQDVYGNQGAQAGATVAQSTVPAAVAKENAVASQAGTAAQYAPAERAAGVNATNAATGLTNANTGVTNQNLVLPPAAIAASNSEYDSAQQNQQLADRSGELGDGFSQVVSGATRGVLGSTWDSAARKWTGDTSGMQQLIAESNGVLAQAEKSGMVPGNATDAATARAVQNVPTLTDSPQSWAAYMKARQKFLGSMAAWSNARGGWLRNNNSSLGPAVRSFTIPGPNGTAFKVNQGDSLNKYLKSAAPSYYSAPSQSSFDPTQ